MTTEQYSIGYDEGYQAGWNAAMDAKPAQQEPVAYMVKAYGMLQRLSRRADVADEIVCQYRKDGANAEVFPLYTSLPAQRKPLTDEEIESINVKFAGSRDLARLFARAIEAAHGIGVEK